MSLINREALIAEYDRVHVGAPGGARKLMVDAPEVQPERKTGHWIDGKLEWHGIVERYCSECGQRLTSEKTVRMKFCPNCGAKMEEGEQDG